MRPLSRIIAALGISGVLSSVGACGWIETVQGIETGRNGAPASSAAAPAAPDGPDITEEAAGEGGLGAPPLPKVKPKPPPLAARSPAAETTGAADVVGLTEDQLETMLGPPKSKTLAEPARIREYESTLCRIRLYLYVDLKTEKYKVLHVSTNPAGLDRSETERCLTDIARVAAAQGGGR